MKKLLSLTLILVMLFGALSACNVRSKDSDTDTSTEIDTSSEIDTNSEIDTSTETDTSTESNASNGQKTKITVNTLLPSARESYNVYEKYFLGEYLGSEIPNSKEPCAQGSYYKLIKSYEELSSLVEHPENVPKGFFEENYILAIGINETATSTAWLAYDNLRYEPHAGVLKIDRYVEYRPYLETIDAFVTTNIYIGISQNSFFLRPYYQEIDSGAIVINDVNIKYYALPETELESTREITELEIGSCFLFDFYYYDNKYDMFTEYGVELKDEEWPHNCESNFCFIAIYARHCKHHVSYENEHITDGKLYLTLNTLEHDEECQNIAPTIKLIAINEFTHNCEKINSETEIIILVKEYSEIN